MLPLAILRAFCSIVSLAVLVLAGYLLWAWYDGEFVPGPSGSILRVREDWRLWTGGLLLAWSFLGRFLMVPLLAKSDHDPLRAEPIDGRMIPRIGGGELYVEARGPADAQPIILTHGWSLDNTMWYYAKRDLAKQFRVIAWDLPGLGRSTRGADGEVSLSRMATDLQTVIGLAGTKSPVLVGHSIGGMIIQTFARDAPERFASEVAGVVLLNTTYTNPLRTMILHSLASALRWPIIEPLMWLTVWLEPIAWLNSWQSYLSGWAHVATRFGFGTQVTRSQLGHITLLLTRARPGVSAKGTLAMFRWDSKLALSREVGMPVLVVGGLEDIVTLPEASETICDHVLRGKLLMVPGANHMGPVDFADVYNREIAAFASGARQ